MNFPNMDLGNILDRYAGGNDQDGNDDDFDQVAGQAPANVMSQGVAEAFRSDRTPPFPSMISNMFGRSDPGARAGLLNQLMAVAGPGLLSGVMGGGGGTSSGGIGGMLSGLFGGMGQGSTPEITPEQAAQVSPDTVEQLAREAEQKDPDIISRVSNFAAEHPTLVKGLGAVAMGIALKHMAGQKRGGLF